MTAEAKVYKIGDVSVAKIEESVIRPIPAAYLFPSLDTSQYQAGIAAVDAADVDGPERNPVLSIHAWLIRTPKHVILLDAGAGNGKDRPTNPVFHQQDLPFLERLAALGVRPEEVDYVFNTHLHVDHVGWNTRLENGKWAPTFPNARYVLPRVEQAYYSSPESHNEANAPSEGAYEDSVQPVVEAGLVDYIEAEGGRYLDLFEFIPTRGHSIGHMSVLMTSQGQSALFAGDLMHHPLQVYLPDLNTVFCEFLDDAVSSRRRMLDYCAANGTLYFPMHFPGPSAGYVRKSGDGFAWTYA